MPLIPDTDVIKRLRFSSGSVCYEGNGGGAARSRRHVLQIEDAFASALYPLHFTENPLLCQSLNEPVCFLLLQYIFNVQNLVLHLQCFPYLDLKRFFFFFYHLRFFVPEIKVLAPGCRRHWIRNGTIRPTGHRAAALEEPVRFPQPIFLTCTLSGVKQMKCPVTTVSFVITPSLRLKFSRSNSWVSHVSVISLR